MFTVVFSEMQFIEMAITGLMVVHKDGIISGLVVLWCKNTVVSIIIVLAFKIRLKDYIFEAVSTFLCLCEKKTPLIGDT